MLAASCLASSGASADTGAGLADFRQGRFAEALEAWQDAAAAGDSRAALFVGVLYDSGLGTEQSYASALTWYRQAAEAGNAVAAFNIGVLFDAGFGVPQDPAQAASWYRRSAAMGYGRAQYNLAQLYEAGAGVPRDVPQAVALYRQAAAQGITAAVAHLARLGLRPAVAKERGGEHAGGGPMDEFAQAQRILLGRSNADVERAAQLFRHSAEQNNPLAEYDLAYCYEHGIGVAQSRTAAYGWYQRAAEHAGAGILKSAAVAGVRGIESQMSEAELRQVTPGR